MTRSTVYRWLNDERIHPSNETTENILSLAKELDPKSTEKILLKETSSFLNRMRNELDELSSQQEITY